MRKAFDANVPKLKPRLRPVMSVPGTTQEKRLEDTDFTIAGPISGNDPNTQDEALNHETVHSSEQESAENASLTDSNAAESPIEVIIDNNVAPGAREEINAIDRNNGISSRTLLNPETLEALTEKTDKNNLPEQVAVSRTLTDSNTPAEIADKYENSEEPLDSIINMPPPDMQASAAESDISPDETPVQIIDDSEARRKRLEDVKRKVSDAVRPEVRIEPVPEDPALAVESVLGLVSDLEAQLSRSKEVEKTLRNELAEVKADLTRTVNDGRTASGRLMQVEAQLDEKRTVLEELLFEMGALEDERDQAVRMVQMLTIKDRERQQELDRMRLQLTEMERTIDENRVEEERLSGELDEYAKENARLHTLLGEITKERDFLVGNAELLTKERDDLLKAKKALEKVHSALSQARARLRE